MIRLSCPSCSTVLTAPENAAGRETSCPKCGQRMRVPDATLAKTVLEMSLAPHSEPVLDMATAVDWNAATVARTAKPPRSPSVPLTVLLVAFFMFSVVAIGTGTILALWWWKPAAVAVVDATKKASTSNDSKGDKPQQRAEPSKPRETDPDKVSSGEEITIIARYKGTGGIEAGAALDMLGGRPVKGPVNYGFDMSWRGWNVLCMFESGDVPQGLEAGDQITVTGKVSVVTGDFILLKDCRKVGR